MLYLLEIRQFRKLGEMANISFNFPNFTKPVTNWPLV